MQLAIVDQPAPGARPFRPGVRVHRHVLPPGRDRRAHHDRRRGGRRDRGPGLLRARPACSGSAERWPSSSPPSSSWPSSTARAARAVQFELRFLRAQISPHFIYNALTAIESFVRSDPDRARELLVEFADFIRYSFRSHGQFVTMAEELRLVDTYLDLERARFGDRLEVTLRVAPEVLSVMLPPFVLQPLVENAVHHGLEPSGQTGAPRDHH